MDAILSWPWLIAVLAGLNLLSNWRLRKVRKREGSSLKLRLLQGTVIVISGLLVFTVVYQVFL